MQQFKNKKIVLTGASRGIGLSLMQKLSAMGAELIVVARNYDLLKQQAEKLENVIIFQADLSDVKDVIEFTDFVKQQWPKADYLINNAGILNELDFYHYNDAAIFRQMVMDEVNVNLLAPMLIVQELLPILMLDKKHQEKAKIVNVMSALGRVPKITAPVYAGTKAAVELFSRVLSYQSEGRAIDIQVVVPDLVATDLIKDHIEHAYMTADEAADQIIEGMMSSEFMIYLGRTKRLFLLHRFVPKIAYKIIRRFTDSHYFKLKFNKMP